MTKKELEIPGIITQPEHEICVSLNKAKRYLQHMRPEVMNCGEAIRFDGAIEEIEDAIQFLLTKKKGDDKDETRKQGNAKIIKS